MKRLIPALFVVSLLSVSWLAADQGKEKGKPKKSAIEGTWSIEKDGGKVLLTFEGDKFTFTKAKGGKSEDVSGTFKLDTKAKPNAIDMSVTGGTAKDADKYKGKTSLGIIKVDGNKLEWCANEPGKDHRPKEFANSDGDMKYLYLTFEREKK